MYRGSFCFVFLMHYTPIKVDLSDHFVLSLNVRFIVRKNLDLIRMMPQLTPLYVFGLFVGIGMGLSTKCLFKRDTLVRKDMLRPTGALNETERKLLKVLIILCVPFFSV